MSPPQQNSPEPQHTPETAPTVQQMLAQANQLIAKLADFQDYFNQLSMEATTRGDRIIAGKIKLIPTAFVCIKNQWKLTDKDKLEVALIINSAKEYAESIGFKHGKKR